VKKEKRMTETLFQKLEEKMMTLLSELEDKRKELEEARNEILRIHHETALLNAEKDKNMKKLQDLLSLLDAITPAEQLNNNPAQATMKPVLVQG
jgi:predicted nuclease with TOPRIM domain